MLRTVSAFTPVVGIPAEEPDHFLTCPVCGQTLVQPDVETFSRCPYCDHVFVKDQAMEDFLLEPNREFHRFLTDERIPHESHESKGQHDMVFWQEYIVKIVKWMFEN